MNSATITAMSRLKSTDESLTPLLVQKTSQDIVCFSHLRWNFVFQRPQHLLSRAAKTQRVFFVEEPVYTDGDNSYLDYSNPVPGVSVVVPRLPHGMSHKDAIATQRRLVNELLVDAEINDFILWYYTPMALAFSSHLKPAVTVYDCMDELSAFKNAPPELTLFERDLFSRADVVFTGGNSLYESKCSLHHNIYCFPSSVDTQHFAKARGSKLKEPADQISIPGPRIGFFGVIDERFDSRLVRGVAKARPDWQIILLGPIVKIDPDSLPKMPNIHYLGGKTYDELPSYIAGWDIAMLPFARNESTRFISPTKTPEYLAAGRPVISTSIPDVVCPYGVKGLVSIADSSEKFVSVAEKILFGKSDYKEWLSSVDDHLSGMSWDKTWQSMQELIEDTLYNPNRYLGIRSSESMRAPLAL
jgi:UDP-galactopyranose mutase